MDTGREQRGGVVDKKEEWSLSGGNEQEEEDQDQISKNTMLARPQSWCW